MQRNREWLQRQRVSLERELCSLQASFDEDERPGLGTHMADQASEVFEQGKNQALRRTLHLTLESVIRALDKMNQGTYNICDQCGGPIDQARLQAHPSAMLCLPCQERAERATLSR